MKYEALNEKILEMQEEIITAVQESIRMTVLKVKRNRMRLMAKVRRRPLIMHWNWEKN